MKKIISLLPIASSMFVASCVQLQFPVTLPHTPAANDPFRTTMQLNYSYSYPAVPAPPATPANGGWYDVNNWQLFLNTPAGGNSGINPDNVFGNMTQLKTKTFQGSKGLKTDGIVGLATYNAAVAAGMTPYPKVP